MVVFFIPIVLSILITLYAIIGSNKKLKIKNLLFQMGIINLIIFLLGGVIWLFVGDGIAVSIGIGIYVVIFVVIELISWLTLHFTLK